MIFRTASRPAFSLIDAIAAIVLLSVALPSMLWAIRDAQRGRANPTMISRACWLAVEKLEDVIADRHSTTRGYSYLAAGNYSAEPTISGFAGFSRSVAISETGASLSGAGTGYKTVTVSVSYPDALGTTKTLSLATVVTDYTP